jgi:hypothetical protein
MRTYLSPIIISIAVIISVIIAAAALKYRYKSSETIVVTGLAEKDFISDQIVWTGNFSRSSFDLRSAYSSLKADEAEIKRYLNASGITDTSIVFSSIDIQKNFKQTFDANGRQSVSEFNGYTLNGTVTVDSKEIQKVEKLSREITGLLEKGIELNSSAPRYYYTKLNELKIDLLAKASQDAKLRAETIADNSKADLGSIKKANMGVFQITGRNSNEDYSYGGAFNTSSKEKTASITLKVEYQVR